MPNKEHRRRVTTQPANNISGDHGHQAHVTRHPGESPGTSSRKPAGTRGSPGQGEGKKNEPGLCPCKRPNHNGYSRCNAKLAGVQVICDACMIMFTSRRIPRGRHPVKFVGRDNKDSSSLESLESGQHFHDGQLWQVNRISFSSLIGGRGLNEDVCLLQSVHDE